MAIFSIKSVALKWFFTTAGFTMYEEFFHVYMKQLAFSFSKLEYQISSSSRSNNSSKINDNSIEINNPRRAYGRGQRLLRGCSYEPGYLG